MSFSHKLALGAKGMDTIDLPPPGYAMRAIAESGMICRHES